MEDNGRKTWYDGSMKKGRGELMGAWASLFAANFLTAMLDQRPSGTPSSVARRKIGEKGVSKGFKAALWNPLLYGGMRGDVPTLYVFALVQFTRFRPVRGVLRTASTDSIVLHHMR